MKEINYEFKDYPDTSTPIPKVMYWYVARKSKQLNKLIHLNAELANELFNNELESFFERYPEELHKTCSLNKNGGTNITAEEEKFYEKELRI